MARDGVGCWGSGGRWVLTRPSQSPPLYSIHLHFLPRYTIAVPIKRPTTYLIPVHAIRSITVSTTPSNFPTTTEFHHGLVDVTITHTITASTTRSVIFLLPALLSFTLTLFLKTPSVLPIPFSHTRPLHPMRPTPDPFTPCSPHSTPSPHAPHTRPLHPILPTPDPFLVSQPTPYTTYSSTLPSSTPYSHTLPPLLLTHTHITFSTLCSLYSTRFALFISRLCSTQPPDPCYQRCYLNSIDGACSALPPIVLNPSAV
ncbi:hypothetical protein Pmani_003815 [Petrolisthes manimaculis]|uniref:Uncharacterized protein n=1 Tax=Petrolisthes manimaculis TaxID=1843537 RepID=A0AAE1UI28_9EUCA|nr:hypothetical protein Pmani_003815 [Petrolisthes manimaculis]